MTRVHRREHRPRKDRVRRDPFRSRVDRGPLDDSDPGILTLHYNLRFGDEGTGGMESESKRETRHEVQSPD